MTGNGGKDFLCAELQKELVHILVPVSWLRLVKSAVKKAVNSAVLLLVAGIAASLSRASTLLRLSFADSVHAETLLPAHLLFC